MVERRSLHDVFRNEKVIFQSLKIKKRKRKDISNIVYWLLKSHCFDFFFGRGRGGGGKYGVFWAKKLMEIWYLLITEKFLFWTFQEWEIQSFLIQKVSEKIIFTDYWNVLVLNFLGMENTASFWSKKLMERWYLLVTEKFLFWAFTLWEIGVFLRQKGNGKMIFTDYWKVLVLGYRKVLALSFLVMGNKVFF